MEGDNRSLYSWVRGEGRWTRGCPRGSWVPNIFSYHGLFNLVVDANQASGTTGEDTGRYKLKRRSPKSAPLLPSRSSLL